MRVDGNYYLRLQIGLRFNRNFFRSWVGVRVAIELNFQVRIRLTSMEIILSGWGSMEFFIRVSVGLHVGGNCFVVFESGCGSMNFFGRAQVGFRIDFNWNFLVRIWLSVD